MQSFGIIGKPLQHSFSAKYFSEKFASENIDAEYKLYPLERIEDFAALCEQTAFTGINVTLPYKEQIIPYLTRLDDTARKIGAVNVVHFTKDGLIGYNTDAIGFMESIRPLLQPNHRKALILGTGGAAKAVHYGLQQLGIATQFVSRNPLKGLTYDALSKEIMKEYTIIVNCTPVGMYPDTDVCPAIPYQEITAAHLLYDVIYNPQKTFFLQKGEAQGATIANGIQMLYGQAEAAWKIWNNR